MPNHFLLPTLLVASTLCLASPSLGQGIGIGVDLGGVGVDVGVGGDSGIDLDVDLGGGTGIDVEIGSGGSGSGSDGLLDTLDTDELTLTQEQALTAVKNKRAKPLEEILLAAQLITDGEIIDAQLIAVQDVLLYELKVLGKAGDVSELYFYALSGLPVDTN